jgi:hypothetical protein
MRFYVLLESVVRSAKAMDELFREWMNQTKICLLLAPLLRMRGDVTYQKRDVEGQLFRQDFRCYGGRTPG